jgi:hypothetical protein
MSVPGGFFPFWAAKKLPITDSWPRERKDVFNLPHSREANGRNVK